MRKPAAQFKRMVLGLPQSAIDYTALELTADFAELFGVNLLATFFEDASLLELAAIPCVRELRPLGGGWQPIDAGSMSKEIERAATSARTIFMRSVKTRAIQTSFQIAKGPPADAITAMTQAEDIIVLIEPRSAGERVAQQFSRLIDAAFRTAAAVMMVPARVARKNGPVVAIAMTSADPSIPAALAIAAAAHERLIVIRSGQGLETQREANELAADAGVTIEELSTGRFPPDMAALAATLGMLKERLIVITRGAFDDAAIAAIAWSQGIPVLVVEPPGAQ